MVSMRERHGSAAANDQRWLAAQDSATICVLCCVHHASPTTRIARGGAGATGDNAGGSVADDATAGGARAGGGRLRLALPRGLQRGVSRLPLRSAGALKV
eukprot:scaffold117414_cov32-Tisochrysis_lutea.AAC.1